MDEGDDDLILPNEVVTEYLARAKNGFAHLGKTWEYHIDNGRAIFEFKKQLEAMIRPNNPDQRAEDTQRWRDSMGEFLRVNHLHEDDPEAIWTKAERTNLMKIMERFHEVEEFRRYYGDTYGSKKLRRLNNPSAVLDKFLTWKGEKKKKAGKPTKQDETVRLVNILDFCCDHLHVGKGGEYTELRERAERFDGTNFVGVSTEDQQIEAGKWHADNERLSGELEKATQAVMNTTGELERVKGQREKQAATLEKAFELLSGLAADPNDSEVGQQAVAFLEQYFPTSTNWGPLWDEAGKKEKDRPPEGVEADPAPAESADEENEVEEVEVIHPDYRQQTDEELIRDWLCKTTRRNAETPTLIHNWLRMKHGREVSVTKVKRLIQKIEQKKPGRPKKQHAAPQPAYNVVAPNPREVRMGEIRAVGAYEGGLYPTNEPAPGPCTWFYAGIFKATNSDPTGEWGVIGDGYGTQEEAERKVERLLAYEAR